MERVLVDTGFFVALGRSSDARHEAAKAYLESCTLQLDRKSVV